MSKYERGEQTGRVFFFRKRECTRVLMAIRQPFPFWLRGKREYTAKKKEGIVFFLPVARSSLRCLCFCGRARVLARRAGYVRQIRTSHGNKKVMRIHLAVSRSSVRSSFLPPDGQSKAVNVPRPRARVRVTSSRTCSRKKLESLKIRRNEFRARDLPSSKDSPETRLKLKKRLFRTEF